jgi:hypothetical protein
MSALSVKLCLLSSCSTTSVCCEKPLIDKEIAKSKVIPFSQMVELGFIVKGFKGFVYFAT